jgi:hypothetical protein
MTTTPLLPPNHLICHCGRRFSDWDRFFAHNERVHGVTVALSAPTPLPVVTRWEEERSA